MKSKIHPKYYDDAKVTCACGNMFTTGSTLPEINTEICSACHPFFTGEMRFVDTQGRVEKFQKRVSGAKKGYQSKKKRKQTQKAQDKKAGDIAPVTLKEMLEKGKKKKTPKKKNSPKTKIQGKVKQ